MRNSPDMKCARMGDFYWDGSSCKEIEVIKNCKSQGGNWLQVQYLPKQLFMNTCVCSGAHFWDGKKCVAQLTPELKKNLVEVWCDSLRKKIVVYMPNAN